MNKRINSIVKYIDIEDIVLDVGCDHALLGIELAKKGIYSYAGDIKDSIISNAEAKAEKLGLKKYITFKVSDGIREFKDYNIDTLIFAGMGTHTILDILKESNQKYKKIITISNNDHFLLRTEMIKTGYKINLEEIIYEKNKYYNLIIFVPGKESYTEEELNLGYNHQNKELLKQRNKHLIDIINYQRKGKKKLKISSKY